MVFYANEQTNNYSSKLRISMARAVMRKSRSNEPGIISADQTA